MYSRRVVLTVLLAFCFLVAPGTQSIEAWGKTYFEAFMVMSFICVSTLINKRSVITKRDLLLLCPVGFYFIVCVTHHYQSNFFLSTLPIFLFLGFFCWITTLNGLSNPALQNLAVIYCSSFVLVCVFYLLHPYGVGLLFQYMQIGDQTVRYSPLIINNYAGFGHPNNMASLIGTVALVLYWLLDHTPKNSFGKLFVTVATTLSAFAIFDTGSRVGALGLIIAATLYICVSEKRYFWNHVKLLVAPIFLGLCLSGADIRLELVDTSENRSVIDRELDFSDRSTEIRLELLSISYKLFKKEPFFGHGLDSFARNYYAIARTRNLEQIVPASHPHNIVADLASELGVAGLLLILGSFALWITRHLKSRKSLLIALTALPLALHLMTEFPQESSISHWAAFGLIFTLARRSENTIDHETVAISGRLSRSLVLCATVPCLLLSLYMTAALQLVTKRSLHYDLLHPSQIIIQDAIDPLRTLPFVSHILDRHVGGKALGTALILGDANIADQFINRYSNTLNYWGRLESYEIEDKAKLLLLKSDAKRN